MKKPVVVGLDNLAPVGGRATGRQDSRYLNRYLSGHCLKVLSADQLKYGLPVMRCATSLAGFVLAGEDFWNTVTRLAGPVPTST